MTRDGHAAAWIRVHNQVSWIIAKSFFFSLKKKKINFMTWDGHAAAWI